MSKAEGLLARLSDVLGDTAQGNLEVRHFLDTGFAPLNKAISGSYTGGLPCGRIVEMYGPPSCGKTAIATRAMAQAIKKGGFAMFMDHERSFDINIARRLGLDDSGGAFVHLRPETLEGSFTTAIKTAQKIREDELIDPGAPIVAVFDSLAAMIPRSKSEKELTELTMADSLALAKATSGVLPTVNLYAEKYDMLVILLNQVRENPGVSYGDPTRTPGGKAPSFYASVRIALRASSLVKKEDGGKEMIGNRITAKIAKNKISKPFEEVSWDFLYEGVDGHFDVIGGLVDHLIELGVIEQKGARINFEGKSYFRNALIESLRADNRQADLEALLPSS